MGCTAAGVSGVGFGVWARNAAAWVIGATLTAMIARIRPGFLVRAVLLIAPLALLVSLFSPGNSGVHRWVTVGPMSWNVSFLLLPAVTVAFAATRQSGAKWAVMLVQLELLLQPDASQATAFAAAGIVTLWTTVSTRQARMGMSLFFVLAGVLTWLRPDPLTPVAEVEGILKLAGAVSGALAALCVASLAAVTASPLLARKVGPPSVALFVYFLGCMVMPLFGAFPVPLAGMGMSPILGFWLGAGALLNVDRKCG